MNFNNDQGNIQNISKSSKNLPKAEGHSGTTNLNSEQDFVDENTVDEDNKDNFSKKRTDCKSDFKFSTSDESSTESGEDSNDAMGKRETNDIQNTASNQSEELDHDPVSLTNHRVNCSINAAIHCIFPALLYLNTIKETIEYDQSQECGAIILMESLLQAYTNQEEFSILNCIYEKSSLEYFSLELLLENMEDAHVFLNNYLYRLNEELKGHSQLQKTPFEAAHDSRYFCNNCGKSNNDKPNIVVDQILFVSVGKNMTEMIENYLNNEVERFNCENCEVKNGSASSEVVFSDIPQYLVVCIKRFATHSYYQTRKINERICIDETIEIPYKSDDKVLKQKYRLVSVVNHIGGVEGEQYLSFLKLGDFWYKTEDDNVQKYKLEDVKNISEHSCYIEVFEKAVED